MITFKELQTLSDIFSKPVPDYCICDGCKNSAGCSWKPLKPPYTSCVDYKVNREVKQWTKELKK